MAIPHRIDTHHTYLKIEENVFLLRLMQSYIFHGKFYLLKLQKIVSLLQNKPKATKNEYSHILHMSQYICKFVGMEDAGINN